MPDTKITALTALTAADPANDMMPIVDVSDTSMAASGTTKRISINNILACSPSATLASATITGDLTVDTSTLKVDSTNNRVGIGTATPTAQFHILAPGSDSAVVRLQATGGRTFDIFSSAAGYGSANNLIIYDITGSAERYRIDSTGIHTWQNVGGVAGTAMTLNSTGLGVGVASPTAKLDIAGAIKSTGDITSSGGKFATGASGQTVGFQLDSFVSGGAFNNYILNNAASAGTNATLHFGRLTSILYGFIRSDNNTQNIEIGTAGTARLTIDQSGNIILATPSTPPTLATNGQLTVNATSNTNLRFSYRGSDGTTRVANITLA